MTLLSRIRRCSTSATLPTTANAIVATVLLLCGSVATAQAADWVRQSPMVNPRSEAPAIDYRGDIYVFNGFGPDILIENTIEKYTVATGKWSIIKGTSSLVGTAVTHNGLIRHGRDVWMIGGRVGSHPGKVTKNVKIFNLDSGQWRNGPDLPRPSASGGAALVNNKIHWFGGIDAKASCDVGYHYTLDLSETKADWKDISGSAPMPMARNHFATTVIGDRIYAIGGQNGHDGCRKNNRQDSKLVHMYNTATGQWERKSDLPVAQSHTEPSTFTYGQSIFMVGGRTAGDKVYHYDSVNDDWELLFKLPQRLLAPVARIVDNKLIVAGGGAPGTRNPLKDVWTRQLPKELLIEAQPTVEDEPEDDTPADTSGNTPTQDPTPQIDAGTPLAIEAEYFDARDEGEQHSWVSQPRANASNADAMVTTPDNGSLYRSAKGAPMLSYLVYFDKPGAYHLWIRGWGDAVNGEGKSDSLHAGLNGELASTADNIIGFPDGGWQWSNDTRDNKPAVLNVPSSGVHAVNIWMREDGFAVDKLVLTLDPGYQPTGQGPAAFDGTTTDGSVSGGTTNDPADSDSAAGDAGNGESSDDSASGNSDAGQDTAGAEAPTSSGNNDDNQADEQGTPVSSSAIVVDLANYSTTKSSSTHEWVKGSRQGSTGKGSMISDIDIGTLARNSVDSPLLNYKVRFDKPGTYTVWVRGWGDTAAGEGKSDSVHVGLNGLLDSAAAVQNFPSGNWTWSSSRRAGGQASVSVPAAGVHTLNVWMREDGLEIDQIMLIDDVSVTPETVGSQGSAADENNGVNGSGNGVSEESTVTEVTDTEGAEDPTDMTDGGETTDNGPFVKYIEADKPVSNVASASHQWATVINAGASGGSAIGTSNKGTLHRIAGIGASMNYTFDIPAAGTYYVHVRGLGDTEKGEGKNDSVYVGVNNIASTAKPVQNFPSNWIWSSDVRGGGKASVSFSEPGTQSLTIWMREDGLLIDQIMVTDSSVLLPETTITQSAANEAEQDDPQSAVTETPTAVTLNSQRNWSLLKHAGGTSVQPRHEAGGVLLNDRIYMLGGRGTRAVSEYNPATKRWRNLKAPPIQLHHFQPVAFDGKIWALGAFTGGYPDETAVADIYTFTPSSNSWAKAGRIPNARLRGGAGVVVHDSMFYLVGGNNRGHRDGAQAWFDRYDPSTGEWAVLPSAPTARDHMHVAVAKGKLVVAGGRQSRFPQTFQHTLSQTDVFDFSKGTWSMGKSLPTKRAGTMSVAVGNEVLVIGGEVVNNSNALPTVEAYNVSTGQWRALQSLNTGRHGGAAVVHDRSIHVISGSITRGGSPKSESTVHETLSF